MVRVLTVHNFANQYIHTVEQPTASTIAAPHRLLLALSSHCIEVRDLKDDVNLLFTFPTVDQVTKIVHCINGDYVATLETKFNRQNREINYVRVYVNWDSIATLQQSKMTTSGASLDSSECGMVQPMRARIAGRVTPTTNQSEIGNLEMIEIPVRQNPHTIECCQISGNILIQSGKTLTIYTFQVKSHDISKLKFVDFEELPIYLEINFVPLKVAFCENYISCLNKDSVHLFKIERKLQKSNEETKEMEYCDTNFKFIEEEVTIDYKELLKKESTNATKDKITVNLPSIVRSNSLIHKHSPFTYIDKDMTAVVRHNFSIDDKYNYEIINLIQLKLKPLLIENSQTQVMEEFRCMVMKPLYVDENFKKYDKNSCGWLKSNYKECLSSVVCFITTSQEGYLFQFTDSDVDTNNDNCVSVYPFMGPVYNVILENHLLHALTETGLESYTVRIGHKLCRTLEIVDNISVACPPTDDLICLIGHKQFVGIEQILLCNNYLVLLASAENSPTHSVGSSNSSTSLNWTLYNLELPSPKMLFTDIALAANTHRFTAPQTYCHLISEAHMILRLSLLLLKWSIREGGVCTIGPSKSNIDDLIDAYRTSCALLGDHYIMSLNEQDYKLCLPYYKMACISPYEVLNRFKRIEQNTNEMSMNAVLYYLTMVLSETKLKSAHTKAEGKQHFMEEILEIFENYSSNDLAHLILRNNMLREYSTSKFINILLHQSHSDPVKETERLLALALLYVQECNIKQAENTIETIANNNVLYQLLVENWKLLFESSHVATTKHKNPYCFSEFSIVLMFTNGDILADIFVSLMCDRKIHLHNILRMFLEYLPSRVGSDGNMAATVMQKTLEQYFKNYFANYDVKNLTKFINEKPSSLQEAVKILVRSYLSELQMLHIKDLKTQQEMSEKETLASAHEEEQKNESMTNSVEMKSSFNHMENGHTFLEKTAKARFHNEFLFSELRFDYLNRMPPFQIEITSKLYETCIENYVSKKPHIINKKADLILKKLQALFCSQIVSKDVIIEAKTFLKMNEMLRGYWSLKSILLDTEEAVVYLLEVCPQCLVQFGKDRFTKNDEWKLLITSLQKKIVVLSVDQNLKRICFYHKKLLKDVLTHLATTMSVEQLQQVLPNQNPNSLSLDALNSAINNSTSVACDDILNEICCYEPYITVCKETMQANQIKKLITTTGQQLLLTLNL